MLNKLWGAIIVIGIVVAAFRGKMGDVGTASIDSSKEAVMLCITMLGVMSMWTGIMNVAKKAGIINGMTKALRPVLHLLFPNVPRDHVANEYMAANIIANVLGLGWACTPAGLKAMEALAKLEEERGNHSHIASNEMCTFLILNISSLQLIPVNMIAYRSKYGSANPAGIIAPAIVATLFSSLIAILYCKIKDRNKKLSNKGLNKS